MGNSKPDKSTLGWVEALQDGHKTQNLQMPEGDGWQSMAEIIKSSPYGECKTRKIIEQKVRLKEIEVYEGTELNAYGRTVRRVWYRQV